MKNCRKIFKNSEYNGTNGKRRQNVESTDKWKRMNTATFEGNKTQFELCSEIKKKHDQTLFLACYSIFDFQIWQSSRK